MKAYESVVDHVEAGILAGTYAPGDTLPSERDLAEQLGVSRAAVREAIRVFEAQGVLTSSVGAGHAGGTRVTRPRSHAVSRLLRLHVTVADAPADEILELRVSLERTCAGLAAGAMTSVALDTLTGTLDAMADPGADIETFNELDTRFHVQLAECAANALVADLTTAVRQALHGPLLAAEVELAGTGGFEHFRDTVLRQHRDILDALGQGDGVLAADRVEAHIRSTFARLPQQQRAHPRPAPEPTA